MADTEAGTTLKGVTPPISQAFPTQAELDSNDNLIEELKAQNNFEGNDETERRLILFHLYKSLGLNLTDL